MVERIEINLLPAEYRVRKTGIHLRREFIWPLLIVGVAAFAVWTYTMGRTAQIYQLKGDVESLEKTITQNKHIQDEINRLRSEKQVTQEKIKALNRITVNREKWVRLMEILCKELPEYSWLVSVDESQADPPVLNIEGRTFSFPEVASYMSRLAESEYIKSVDLTEIERLVDLDKQGAYRFKISCVINPDAQVGSTPSNTVHGVADSTKKVR